MSRATIQNKIGVEYLTTNIEAGEYSYVKAAGSREKLQTALSRKISHFKVDLRFFDETSNVAVLIETKQSFTDNDVNQLQAYVDAEKALYPNNKIVAILANTTNEELRVWKSQIDTEHELPGETTIDTMAYYTSLFESNRQNDREKVLRNTYALNELLHKKDIDERLRSQFVGTTLLYVKEVVAQLCIVEITDKSAQQLRGYWSAFNAPQIRTGIETTLNDLLDGSDNKHKKIKLLRTNVVQDQQESLHARKNR